MASAAAQKRKYYTPEEYLARERRADFKSEYLDGEIYAMAGAKRTHCTATVNATTLLGSQLWDKPCQVFNSDMKVRAGLGDLYSYPDLSVVCGEPQFQDAEGDVLLNPVLIIEVLSSSTELFDRGTKFLRYQQIESLVDYILIAQDEPRIEHFSKRSEQEWVWSLARGLDSEIRIESIGCTLRLADVYKRALFPPKPAPDAVKPRRRGGSRKAN